MRTYGLAPGFSYLLLCTRTYSYSPMGSHPTYGAPPASSNNGPALIHLSVQPASSPASRFRETRPAEQPSEPSLHDARADNRFYLWVRNEPK